jgi:hypothetical protein
MKIISFDVGIKNLAYCIFNIENPGSPITIDNWNVLNLLDDKPDVATCNCKLVQKKKSNTPAQICGKKAKFKKNDLYYCEKHAKMSGFLLPNKEYSPASLKKMKIEDLQSLGNKYGVFLPENVGTISFTPPTQIAIPTTKKGYLEKMLAFFEKKTLEIIKPIKTKSANDTDLVCIGKNMKKLLNEIPGIEDITHVIIENQISTIATRMKTIQGMCAQYFIMKCSQNVVIEFISSINKLKDFKDKTILENDGSKTAYKQHKKDGITFCKNFIDANPQFSQWGHCLETTKKDDLADSFLQGIWYLKNKNIITYAENLKINSVYLS